MNDSIQPALIATLSHRSANVADDAVIDIVVLLVGLEDGAHLGGGLPLQLLHGPLHLELAQPRVA